MDLTKTLKLDETVKIDGEFNGEKFWFNAKTNALTPQLRQQMTDLATRPIEYANAMAEIVTDWDITIGKDAFPPTAENLARVPEPFLDYLLDKIGACWLGNAPPLED